ncbi:hypothetical protein [Leptolyngbya sp. 7M]|uniref:hypothetical protein n=1 Tax=Leptolyngbya sp. 7M TaxID=2812896 RepID=UPI001B8C81B8|nr:hypothetical protein [Leptolyngbya sp. 7M]QYO63285.1 hypothetical protein JVX88_25610 [Leptolyngbya sp. 7M]
MTSPLEEKQTHQQIEQIKTDLRKAQQEGQLRTERIREIVRDAVAQVAGEVKQGSGEIQVLAKEALNVVIETLQGRGKELRDDLAASIEGIIDGISHARRDAINQSQAEVNQLQAQIQQQEEQLNAEIEGTLTELETDALQRTLPSSSCPFINRIQPAGFRSPVVRLSWLLPPAASWPARAGMGR